MRTFPITTQVSNAYYSKNSNVNNQQNPSFKAVTATWLLLKYGREGYHSLIKGKDRGRYLRVIQEYMAFPNATNYLEGIQALAKTPNAFYDYHHQGGTSWWDSWTKGEKESLKYVDTLRHDALYNFSKLPDDSLYTVQSKKEFLRSFFINGHELTKLFIEKFSELNDNYYDSFKKEIVDECISSKNYNKARAYLSGTEPCYPEFTAACDPFNKKGYVCDHYDMYNPDSNYVDRDGVFLERLYNNLKLISTLDKKRYHDFIEGRRGLINQMKQRLEHYFYRVEKKGCSYKIPNLLNDYNTNLKSL